MVIRVLLLMTLAAASLFGQADRTGGPPQAPARQRCSSLQGMAIPRDAIGVPTNAAVVVSASFVMAADVGNTNGEFCKVLGSIHPVDPTAPDIKFEVNLPSNWNNKLLQLGGGGFDGSLVTGLGGVPNQMASSSTPLAQGYLTLGSDSGHEGAGFDATFALNDEALANFGHLQIKKTHDAAMYFIKVRSRNSTHWAPWMGGWFTDGCRARSSERTRTPPVKVVLVHCVSIPDGRNTLELAI